MPIIPVADTAGSFADFSPYVPCMAGDGTVAFQAALRDGSHGVFAAREQGLRPLVDTRDGRLGAIYSHPALGPRGACFYATLGTGERALCLVHDGGALEVLADTTGELSDVGPLGPTMNEAGAIAFRASLRGGGAGVFVARDRTITHIADTRGDFARFHGLPVINAAGTVVFRADLGIGREGLYKHHDGEVTAVAETGGHFVGLGLFPSLDDSGQVAFWAELKGGGAALFTARGRELTRVLDTSGAFESFRGALPVPHGLVFYAVPRGGRMGVFKGPDPAHDRILGLGDELLGATVTDFALNPVSVNARGQLAMRVRLSDLRQLIVRVDPDQAGIGSRITATVP